MINPGGALFLPPLKRQRLDRSSSAPASYAKMLSRGPLNGGSLDRTTSEPAAKHVDGALDCIDDSLKSFPDDLCERNSETIEWMMQEGHSPVDIAKMLDLSSPAAPQQLQYEPFVGKESNRQSVVEFAPEILAIFEMRKLY